MHNVLLATLLAMYAFLTSPAAAQQATNSTKQERVRAIEPPILVDTMSLNLDSLRRNGQIPGNGGRTIIVNPNNREDERVTVARQLMRDQNFESAAALLETIHESNPADENVANLFRACLMQLKQFDKAARVIRQQLSYTPKNYSYRIALAELCSQLADTSCALAQYDSSLALLKPHGEYTAQPVLRSLIDFGWHDKAIATIKSLRAHYGNPALYNFEEGSLKEKQQDYPGAVAVYLTIATVDSTSRGNDAERRLSAMLAFGESAAPTERALTGHIASATLGPKATFLLSEHFLRLDRFDDAMSMCLLLDSAFGGADGYPLLSFMQAADRRKAYQPLLAMADKFHHRYPASSSQASVFILQARALTKIGRGSEAMASYDKAIALVTPAQQAELLLAKADVQLELLNQPAEALRSLAAAQSIPGLPATSPIRTRLRRLQPCAQARTGDFVAARALWDSLAQIERLPDDWGEEIAFSLGQMSLFTGQYDSAAAQFKQLIVRWPRGVYVNDCLRLLRILEEIKEAAELRATFAAMEKFLYLRQPDSARSRLRQLVDGPDKQLAPIALLALAEMELQQADTIAALGAVDQLTTEYADSFQVPYGLKLRGDLLFGMPNRRGDAKAIYLQLLSQFPNFPYASDVRKKLRELDGQS